MENPEFFQAGDQFIIEDLLDFPNDETMALDEAALDTRTDSTVVADAGICKPEPHFHQEPGLGELCLPYDDLAELEWLSNFVEESFSSDEFQKLQLIQGGIKAQTTSESPETHQYQFQPETTRPGSVFRPEMSVPAKARSKRSRAAPGNWTSRLLVVSPPPASSTSSSSTDSDVKKTTVKQAMPKKKEVPENSGNEGRKCLHCATDKTPQWRTGPMGPKTLCNACGVRYKSGRLVPEYRPAASPTFVLTKHSNSHRKVLELRKQKEMRSGQPQFHHQNYMFDHMNNNNGDDYLIHQHIGPDFRQMI